MCRCSQPLSGFSARCVEDEQMLHAILKANPKSNFMYVVDTRPKVSAELLSERMFYYIRYMYSIAIIPFEKFINFF